MIYKWGVDVNVWSRKSPAHVDGEQVLKKWKKSKKMTVAFGGILVMSVVIGGCGGRKMPKEH